MLHTVQEIPNLEVVDLKFMESWHNYIEVDSIHARIEKARKHKRIYTVREYGLIIAGARLFSKPYDVHFMRFQDIQNWKAYSNLIMSNVKTDTSEN